MPRRALRLIAPPILVVGLVLAAAAPVAAAPPKAWAGDVCGAIDRWVKALEKRSASATAKVTRRATPSKKTLLRMLDGAKNDSDKLLQQLASAGTPSGPGAKKVAKSVRESYAQVKRTISQTATALGNTKPKQLQKFIDRARHAQDGLENGLERVEAIFGSTKPLDNAALVAAFAGAGACQGLSQTTTAASNSAGPDGEVSIASIDASASADGRVATYAFANVDADGRQRCVDSSAYRVELLGPDGAQLGFGGDTVDIPSDAPAGNLTIRVVCYFPGRYVRPLMRSLCGQLAVTAPGVTATAGSGRPCPATGRVLDGDAVIAAQRALGDGFNILLGTIYGP